ncbi:MAG: ribonucleoside triphosphate reductase [Patescibacteria group bacterium]|nr:ribonucleoside triphosphate reductase [Patescibacteria group bacterium]
MPQYVRKRDGKLVPFNVEKIFAAIWKAVQSVGGEDASTARKIADRVRTIIDATYPSDRIPSVEYIQDTVEKILIEDGHAKVAKAYIIYREQHRQMREMAHLMNESITLVESYLQKADWRVKENANMEFSLQGLNNHIFASISEKYWLEKIYPKEIRDSHINGELKLHDLGLLAPYCCGWDLQDLLMRGFGGVPGKVQCKPPKRLRPALGQVVNFLYTLQGEAAGAEAFSSFDTLLAPFVRYENLNYTQVKQAMQEFMFNMAVPTRVGFQTPFTNLSFDLSPSPLLADQAVIVGGEMKIEKYGDFQKEMDMINKAFIEVMTEGDATGQVFTFPIPTYNITKDFDWNGEIAQMIFEMTAKYGLPYFSNFINSDMKPEDARSMCCRLRLDNRELRKRGGGLFGSMPLTGSIGVVTLNMPQAAYLSSTREEFFARVTRLMDLAHQSLKIKRKMIEKFTENGLYPYSRVYLQSIKDHTGSYWSNHFSTIGLLGMNEACQNLLGADKDIASREGYQLAIETLDLMRERLISYQEETGYIYNLEATPGEGTTRQFAVADKRKFPDIITAARNENDVPYYTNSTHLPVDYTDDIFKALKHQDPLQCKYTGGTVFHGFFGERMSDAKTTGKLVKKIAENFSLPYFTITPTFSICPKHGYLSGEHEFCPKCDDELRARKSMTQKNASASEMVKDARPKKAKNKSLN